MMTPQPYSTAFCEALANRLDIEINVAALQAQLDDARAKYFIAARFSDSAATLRNKAKRIEKAASKLLEELDFGQPGGLEALVQLCAGFEIMSQHGAEVMRQAHLGEPAAMLRVQSAIELGSLEAAQAMSAVQKLSLVVRASATHAGPEEFLENTYGGGGTAIKHWIWDLLSAYERATGKPATVSKNPTSPDRSIGGKFADFARSAIRYSVSEEDLPSNTLDRHIERIVTEARQHVKT